MKPEDLKKKLAVGDEVVLIDVREQDEAATSGVAIEGSQNIPMGKVFTEAAQGHLPKDKKIIAICKTGGRCEIVAKELKEKGYDIDYLEGGIEGWQKTPDVL